MNTIEKHQPAVDIMLNVAKRYALDPRQPLAKLDFVPQGVLIISMRDEEIMVAGTPLERVNRYGRRQLVEGPLLGFITRLHNLKEKRRVVGEACWV